MKISICSILRNNETWLKSFLIPSLQKLEKKHDLSYYFYENDSTDNTKQILKDFIKNRKGKILCENLGKKSYGRSLSVDRIINIANCRNKLLSLKPFIGDWVIFLDSDVVFGDDLLEKFNSLILPPDLVALGCNGKDHVKCLKHINCNHYYDTLALIDMDNILGYNYSAINNSQCCHLSRNEDRNKFLNGELVRVKSAFGGLAFYKSSILNEEDIIYKLSEPNIFVRTRKPIYCEHWDFNKKLRKFGNIYITPQIIVKNIEK